VEVRKDGFAVFSAKNLEQLVGQTRTLDARLEIARGREETTVTEPLVQVDRVDATIGAPIEITQIGALPVNGETGRR
jgi:hypothetical protein